jgi:acyl-CoA synthetase (NDP forming)
MAQDLSRFFEPRSIAILGVSRGEVRFGGASFLSYIRQSRYAGRVYPIHPQAEEIQGVKAYGDLKALPEVPDLAIVSVPAAHVPGVLGQCADAGVRHVHILTAGFGETGTVSGRRLEESVAAIARERGLLVIGPNCMGAYCPRSGLTLWGAVPGEDGPVGVVGQSGAVLQRLTEHLGSLGLGVGKAASIGNATVLDATDWLAFMAEDPGIRVLALYVEGAGNPRRFHHLAREVCRRKPVILLKGGESPAGAATASSHTGRMAGGHGLWDAACRQGGLVMVRDMDEWADAILAFSLLPAPAGPGVFLVGGGGGHSVIHADACVREGLEVPPLSRASMEALRRSVPRAGSIVGNPLDHWLTFADPAVMGQMLDLAGADSNVHMVMADRLIGRKAFHMPEMPDPTPGTIEAVKGCPERKPTVFTVDSDGGDPALAAQGAAVRASFCRAGIPAFPSVPRAARALAHLWRYHRRFAT